MSSENAATAARSSTDCYLSVVVGGQMRVLRNNEKYTDSEFIGRYKGREIHCWLDRDDYKTGGIRFYIIVTVSKDGPNDGCVEYDGWAPVLVDTIERAVAEAIRGACL